MKIMYLLFSFSVGGTERLVVDICNEMVARGNEIHLYIVNDLVSEDLLSSLDEKVIIYLQGRKKGKGEKLSTLFKVSQYVRNNGIEVIHCNSLYAPELLYVSFLRNPKTRIIYTVHGLDQYKSLGTAKRIVRNYICDSIIGISNAVTADLIKNGANSDKTICIYNGIQPSKYQITKTKSFNKKNVIIGCLARIMPKVKGQDVLLNAIPDLLEKYPDIEVVFAGGIADDQKQAFISLQEFIRKHNLDKHVRFLGSINYVPDFLQSIDICVIPSRSEGFGLTLIEAMSMGVPCIASDVGGLSEIVNQEGVGMLFESGNSRLLSETICDMIENFHFYKDEALKNKDIILNRYSISRMCNLLEKVYRQGDMKNL